MKLKPQAGVALLTLIILVFLGIISGGQLLKLISGPAPLSPDQSLKDAEGSYVTYEVTHPVASFTEKYYSGDQNRASKLAYVIYDEERRIFLKIVIPERNKSRFNSLMEAVNMPDELKEEWGDRLNSRLEPISVTGSFALLTDSDSIDKILDAMTGPNSESTEAMNAQALAQTDWYVLEDGYVQGLSAANLRICTVAMGLNLLFLIISLISLLTKGNKTSGVTGSYGEPVEQLLNRPKARLEPWCARGRKNRTKTALLTMFCVTAALIAIGIFVGYSVPYILTCHLPIGLFLGDRAAAILQ